jgi:S-adenosylmethionine:tRNA ribosyltransferase-isomerase
MKKTQDIRIEEFDYPLENERIAKYPLEQRDLSKLLVFNSGSISEKVYQQLPSELPANCHLVFNNTKVIQARLLFQLPTGRTIEIFCLEPDSASLDISIAMQQVERSKWWCLVGGAKKWKEDVVLEGKLGDSTIYAKRIQRSSDSFLIEFSWKPKDLSFAAILDELGKTPLPPYMKRTAEETDKSRYQTVYAEHEGSVAAPTAGLHFTPELLSNLDSAGFHRHFVTLHVGAGTFKPVSSGQIGDHDMHHELIQVSTEKIVELSKVNGPIIPVGTTSMRTLESLYWLGVKAWEKPDLELKDLRVLQWDPYHYNELPDTKTALSALANYLKQQGQSLLMSKTQLMIAPGYKFKVCKGLVTNFHQPKSTLLLLVSALIGDDWKKVYQHALDNDFRFLSYGDGSLLLP